MATISYYLIEQPALRLGRRWLAAPGSAKNISKESPALAVPEMAS
jgi:peptidoglycan/LPS O-acetylase OafA/YrhL